MASSMEYHQEQLQKHCRICGNRLNKAKGRAQPVYSCKEHSADLLVYAGVRNISIEDSNVFPQWYCNPCHSRLKRAKQAAKDGLPFHSITAVEWSPHQEGCKVCLHFQQVSKGGGRNLKEAKGRGRPAGETPRAVIDHIRSIAPPSPLQDNDDPQFLSSPTLKKLLCSLCLKVALRPVELSCEHMVCSGCCCKAIQVSYSLKCPCCSNHTLSSQTIRPPSSLFMSLVNDLLVKCAKGCSGAVRLQDYNQHCEIKCCSFRQNLNSPSKITLKDVLGKSSTSPATPVEVEAAHSPVKRLLNQGEGSSSSPPVIKVGSSQGQPITLVQVLAGRVETTDACTKTVLRRTKTLREIASCGDSTSKLGAEIKAMSRMERQSLQQAQLPITVPAKKRKTQPDSTEDTSSGSDNYPSF